MSRRRNISNITTFDDLYASRLDIVSSGTGLTISAPGATIPAYSFDPVSQSAIFTGDLNVSGDAVFNTIEVSEFAGGILNLASNNTSDVLDIGINGSYDTIYYTGLVRQASDILKRWTFYDSTLGPVVDTVVGINSSTLASVRADYIYLNDGTSSLPSIVFDSDIGYDTGFYRSAENTIGITAGGNTMLTIGTSSIDVLDGSSLNIGTSGLTSTLNIYGSLTSYSSGLFVGAGSSGINTASLIVSPSVTTPVSGINNYYFSYFDAPTTSGSTTGSAYTVFIAGAPSGGSITNPYALYVSSGTTYLRATLATTVTTGTAVQNSSGWTYSASASAIVTNYNQTISDTRIISAWTNTVSSNAAYFGLGSTLYMGVQDAAVVVTNAATPIQLCPNSVPQLIVKSSGIVQLASYLGASVLGTDSLGNIVVTATTTTGTNSLVLSNAPTFTGTSTFNGISAATVSVSSSLAVTGSGTSTFNGLTTVNGNLIINAGVVNHLTINNNDIIGLTTSDNIIESSFAGGVLITLPDVTTNVGRSYTIIKTSTTASGSVTINTTSSQTINDGASTSIVLESQYDRVVLLAGSTQWYTM